MDPGGSLVPGLEVPVSLHKADLMNRTMEECICSGEEGHSGGGEGNGGCKRKGRRGSRG